MNGQLRYSFKLLLFLGLLLSAPIVAKTMAAHGALAAFGTALLVVLAVYLGPLCYVLARLVEPNLFNAAAGISNQDAMIAMALAAVLLLIWFRRSTAPAGRSTPYLWVAAWGLAGVYFCLAQVMIHII